MPASLNRIRDTMQVKPAPQNKGWTLNVTIKAYDTGMVEVDGVPMANNEVAWSDAIAVATLTINEFRDQAHKRQRG